MPGRLRGWRRWVLEGALFLLLFLGLRAWLAQDLAAGAAPPLPEAALTEATRPDLPDEPVVVHFWATWCPVCRAEEGAIDALARDHRVITVALQSGDAAEIHRYLSDAGLSFPVIPDPDGRIAAAWGVNGVPATFVVQAGRIRFRERGYTTGPGLRARIWLARALP